MRNLKLIIIIAGAIVITGLIAWSIYYQVAFFSTGTTPSNNSTAPTTSQISASFNQPLADSMADSLSIEPYVPGVVTIEDNEILFTPSTILDINEVYTVSIKQPTSKKGKTLKDLTFTFTSIYVPFNEQKADRRQSAIEASNSLEKAYPIVQHLPHETTNYKITYGDRIEDQLKLTIELYAILNHPRQLDTYRQQLRDYQQEALDYLRSKGASPDDYLIEYSPDPNSNR